MSTGLRNKLALAISSVVTAMGFATGIAWAGCTSWCMTNTYGCVVLNDSMQQVCCVDLDGDHVYHCSVCWRDLYQCGTSFYYGNYYGCTGAGPVCNS
jgi:hypothetical protein